MMNLNNKSFFSTQSICNFDFHVVLMYHLIFFFALILCFWCFSCVKNKGWVHDLTYCCYIIFFIFFFYDIYSFYFYFFNTGFVVDVNTLMEEVLNSGMEWNQIHFVNDEEAFSSLMIYSFDEKRAEYFRDPTHSNFRCKHFYRYLVLRCRINDDCRRYLINEYYNDFLEECRKDSNYFSRYDAYDYKNKRFFEYDPNANVKTKKEKYPDPFKHDIRLEVKPIFHFVIKDGKVSIDRYGIKISFYSLNDFIEIYDRYFRREKDVKFMDLIMNRREREYREKYNDFLCDYCSDKPVTDPSYESERDVNNPYSRCYSGPYESDQNNREDKHSSTQIYQINSSSPNDPFSGNGGGGNVNTQDSNQSNYMYWLSIAGAGLLGIGYIAYVLISSEGEGPEHIIS